MNTPRYAGFGMRMLASIIDTLLSTLFLLPFFNIAERWFFIKPWDPMHDPAFDPTTATWLDILKGAASHSGFFILENTALLLMIILFWIFCSATPGKMLLRMTIVNAHTFEKPTNKQYLIRSLGYFVSTIALGLGFMWIYFDKKTHRGWHDLLANTAVIYQEKKQNKV